MVHERVQNTPLPLNSLLFEGSTYDLGWDGRRDSNDTEGCPLPTADYVSLLHMIGAKKVLSRLTVLFTSECCVCHRLILY